MRRALVLISVFIAVGCRGRGAEDPKNAVDAEANSGADATRAGAVAIALGTAANDDVSFDKQDRTDWKRVQVPGKGGVLVVQLNWDTPEAALTVDAFDSQGRQIASSPTGAGQPLKLLVAIETAGVYFLRVQAVKAGDASIYTMLVKYDANEPPPPIAPPDAGVPDAAATEEPSHDKPDEPELSGVEGRIVQSAREGGALRLYIDKGSAAGLTVGTRCHVLEGPNGASPLAGGTFAIVQVIDGTRSIGDAKLRSLGRHTRVLCEVK